jgi:hypothetical protein
VNAKLVVALLLLLALLFAAFVVRGDRRGQRPLPDSSEIDPDNFPGLKRFDAMFGPKRTSVDLARLADQCGLSDRAFVLGGNESCDVLVAPGKDEVGFLVLRLERGVGVDIGYEPRNPPEDADSPEPESIRTGKTLRIPVQADGGTLSLACRGTAACRILLVD